MAKKIRRIFAMCLALCLFVTVLPVNALAAGTTETATETSTEGGITTVVTTTTTTTTDENGNSTVTVTVETVKTGIDETGAEVNFSETTTDTTTVVVEGNKTTTTQTSVTDGSESREWDELPEGYEAVEAPEVSVGMEAGTTTSASDKNSVTTTEDGTETTVTTEREVSVTTGKLTVTINDSSTGESSDEAGAIVGLPPVYDEDDGKIADNEGKVGVFDRNYLSSKTLDYIEVNGVSIWVDKGSKTIVDIVAVDGAELPDHELLNGIAVGSNVANWYNKSNSFQTKNFPAGTQYKGGAKTNVIDNWYDENGNLIVTIPDGADFRYVGTGEHSIYWTANVYVEYAKEENEDGTPKLDENGEPIYLKDENGDPIIKTIRRSQGDPITIDGVPITELPEGISLVPVVDNYNGSRPVTFMLMDENGNRVYGYCCDIGTGTVSNNWYSFSNLEDCGYYASEESEAHVRSIVMNGYWGTSDVPNEDGTYQLGSLEGIKQSLRDAVANGELENTSMEFPVLDEAGNPVVDEEGNPVMETKTMLELIDSLTEGEALLATQAAIWSYSNGSYNVQSGKDGMTIIDPDGYKWNHDYTQTGNFANKECMDDYGSARVDFLYTWLINLDTEENSTVVINEQNHFEDMTLTVGEQVGEEEFTDEHGKTVTNGIYETALNFTLAFIPTENDDLLMQLKYTDADGIEHVVVRRLAGENEEGEDYSTILPDENGTYTISGLKLSENKEFNFDLRLEGTQYLENGVYVYQAVGGREESQTMVGIAQGEREVDISVGMTVEFSVDEKENVVINRSWHNAHDPITEEVFEPIPDEEDEEEEEEELPPAPVFEVNVDGGDAVVILDEEVPLADAPKTGSDAIIWVALSIFAAMGMATIRFANKKRQHETF